MLPFFSQILDNFIINCWVLIDMTNLLRAVKILFRDVTAKSISILHIYIFKPHSIFETTKMFLWVWHFYVTEVKFCSHPFQNSSTKVLPVKIQRLIDSKIKAVWYHSFHSALFYVLLRMTLEACRHLIAPFITRWRFHPKPFSKSSGK